MTTIASVLAACVLGLSSGAGFITNEVTHGGLAESFGMDHHHLADVGGYHCANHTSSMGAQHAAHMHNGTMQDLDHAHCPGGYAMHGDHYNHTHGGGMHGS